MPTLLSAPLPFLSSHPPPIQQSPPPSPAPRPALPTAPLALPHPYPELDKTVGFGVSEAEGPGEGRGIAGLKAERRKGSIERGSRGGGFPRPEFRLGALGRFLALVRLGAPAGGSLKGGYGCGRSGIVRRETRVGTGGLGICSGGLGVRRRGLRFWIRGSDGGFGREQRDRACDWCGSVGFGGRGIERRGRGARGCRTSLLAVVGFSWISGFCEGGDDGKEGDLRLRVL